MWFMLKKQQKCLLEEELTYKIIDLIPDANILYLRNHLQSERAVHFTELSQNYKTTILLRGEGPVLVVLVVRCHDGVL